jgi:hypothetical protein
MDNRQTMNLDKRVTKLTKNSPNLRLIHQAKTLTAQATRPQMVFFTLEQSKYISRT